MFVLVRPVAGLVRAGGRGIARLLVAQVKRAVESGAAGIVAGAITQGGKVDTESVETIVAAAAPLPVTFHRAFDELPDQAAALEALIALGVSRVLTSGGAPTALEGAASIEALVRQAGGRIGILPGGAVRSTNARTLVERTGARELHSRTPNDAQAVRALVDAANGRLTIS